MSLHIEYCEGFGMTKEEIEAAEESQGMTVIPAYASTNVLEACTAYTR
jgi:tRNA C32,U32 (ribose-2'-O)-methylase TrmJ